MIKTCLASLAILEVKMLIVENVTEAEPDGLCRIIEQQANEIVKLQNNIRVLEQDLVSAKSECCKERQGILDRHTSK